MEEVIIVDGYNILHAWPELDRLAKESNLEHARLRLIEELNNYQGFSGAKIVIVFDAYYVPNSIEKTEKIGNTEILFSAQGQTADMVIERLVGQWIEDTKVYVATSDYNEQKVIFGLGAYRLSAREFIREVKKARQEIKGFYVEPFKRDNELGARISEATKEILEKWRRQK